MAIESRFRVDGLVAVVTGASSGLGVGFSKALAEAGADLALGARRVDRLDETKNFDQEFSFYQDFPQNQTLTQVEKNLIPKLVDQIILDLFNKIAGDW